MKEADFFEIIETIEHNRFSVSDLKRMIDDFVEKHEGIEECRLVEIAKTIARLDGAFLSENISLFGIADEETLWEIAQLALHEHPLETCRMGFARYCLSPEKHYALLCQALGKQEIVQDVDLVKNILFCRMPSNHRLHNPHYSLRLIQTPSQHVLDEVVCTHPVLHPLAQKIRAMQEGEQRACVRWMGYSLFLLDLHRISVVSAMPHLLEVCGLKRPHLRYSLSTAVALQGIAGTSIIDVLVHPLPNPSLKEGVCAHFHHRMYKDGNAKASALTALHTLMASAPLTTHEKAQVLQCIFTHPPRTMDERKQKKNQLEVVRALVEFRAYDALKGLKSAEELNQSLNAVFRRALNLDAVDWEAALEQWSQPREQMAFYALYKYTAQLQTLSYVREMFQALDCLKEWTMAVIRGDLGTWRHDTKRNPHLSVIEEHHPGILSKWQKKRQHDHGKYIVQVTDHWSDLLLCGEVTGSCLRVGERVIFNKCLLGPLVDGKHMLLVIKEAEGERSIARCMLRLLWDEGDKTAVLVLEKCYRDPHVQGEMLSAMETMGREVAKELGIPLVRAKNFVIHRELRYPNHIVALEGPAPFEYVDAADLQVQRRGSYTIPCYYLENVS